MSDLKKFVEEAGQADAVRHSVLRPGSVKLEHLDARARSVQWDSIEGKPSTFPPSVHSHPVSEITGIGNKHLRVDIQDFWQPPFWVQIPDKPTTFPPSSHGHVQADIDGLKTTDSPTFEHLHLTNGQIGFPAIQVPSADPNTFDDYEEGAWTPVLTFAGASVGITYSVQVGAYTKIGNRAFANAIIVLTSKGSSVGYASITGLPFTNSGSYDSVGQTWLRYITFANAFQGRLAAGTSVYDFQEITEAGALSDLTDADFANNSQIIMSVNYLV